jgi:hypothetical protein
MRVVVLATLAAGCGDAGTGPDLPIGPSLTGWVALWGERFDDLGRPLGRRTVPDGDGVPVELIDAGGATRATAHTQAGRFQFADLEAGTYRVRTQAGPLPPVESAAVAIAASNVALPDTLVLGPAGTLTTYPSPATPEHGIGFEFVAQEAQTMHFRVLGLDLQPVWTDSSFTDPGFIHVHWSPAPGLGLGAYWGLAHHDGAWHRNLLFLER